MLYSCLLEERDTAFYLRILVSKFLRISVPDARKIVEPLRGESNDTFLSSIQKHHSTYIKKEKSAKWLYNSNHTYFNKILQDFNINNTQYYLDFGCGDGYKSKVIGDILHIPSDNIYGLDINPSNNKNIVNNINIVEYDGIHIPTNIINKPFDFITCFQVLHHIEENNIKSILKDLISTLSIGGLFLLKEHDCSTESMKLLVNLQHIFYDIDTKVNYPVFTYYSKQQWIDLFEHLNMKPIAEKEDSQQTATFYILFRKIQ